MMAFYFSPSKTDQTWIVVFFNIFFIEYTMHSHIIVKYEFVYKFIVTKHLKHTAYYGLDRTYTWFHRFKEFII